MDHRRPMDHSLQNIAIEIKRLVTGGSCSLLRFMAGGAADCHILSLTPLGCPLKGTGRLSRCSVLLASCCPCNTCALRLYPWIHAMLPGTPTRSAPGQSTIAQGMQNNAGLFWLLQADTLAPPAAFELCYCWLAGTDSFPLLSPCFINCHVGGFDLPWSQALPKDLLYCSAPFNIIARESCAVGNDQGKETH